MSAAHALLIHALLRRSTHCQTAAADSAVRVSLLLTFSLQQVPVPVPAREATTHEARAAAAKLAGSAASPPALGTRTNLSWACALCSRWAGGMCETPPVPAQMWSG